MEKTASESEKPGASRKHLHGRGEDSYSNPAKQFVEETPPRTWRRPPFCTRLQALFGNTSTDVEKTRGHKQGNATLKKHLHGRGEDLLLREWPHIARETPPRTWRRPQESWVELPTVRNTSTDVEKTYVSPIDGYGGKKHLHGRGEDNVVPRSVYWIEETPPRTWRRPVDRNTTPVVNRNTSTDVEKTICCCACSSSFWKHLHGRGEDSKI